MITYKCPVCNDVKVTNDKVPDHYKCPGRKFGTKCNGWLKVLMNDNPQPEPEPSKTAIQKQMKKTKRSKHVSVNLSERQFATIRNKAKAENKSVSLFIVDALKELKILR